jgi:hypothetical protein
VPTADQLLARLYALRKDYADDPEDETFQALHAAFLFVSYNMNAFKEFVKNDLASGGRQAPDSPTKSGA